MNLQSRIYKKIKKYNSIVIARHIGPDPDALASSIALRDTILNTFPNKKVYAVGLNATKFKFLGMLDKFQEDMYENSLLIITDTPDRKRVDGVDITKFKEVIKIDHHPFVEKVGELEWIDEKASSTCQMIIELILNTKLVLTREVAEKLYMGLVSDTNRFLYSYTTTKTFDLVSKMIKKTNINFTSLYDQLYLRPFKEIKFQGYISNNINITENGLGYIKTEDNTIEEYGIDASTANNLVSNFNYIEEMLVWVFFANDKNNGTIKGSIRSRGPEINKIAVKFGGGGHAYACGVRLKTEEEILQLIKDLDQVCLEYKENNS